MLLARVAQATKINVASLFQAFTLICREFRNVVKHAFLVLIFWDKKLLVLFLTLFATMLLHIMILGWYFCYSTVPMLCRSFGERKRVDAGAEGDCQHTNDESFYISSTS